MAGETTPLLYYLKRPNPEVDSTWSLKDGRSGSKSKGRHGPHDNQLLHDVLEWKGMEWRDLKPIFEDILDLPVNNMPQFEEFLNYPSHIKEISDESSLDTLLIRWNYPVVSTALSVAQDHAKFQDLIDTNNHPNHISMARGGQAWIPKEKKLAPDWAGILLSCPENSQPSKCNSTRHYLNVLPGDTKLSTKFKSTWGWKDQRFKDPVIQVFTYCRRASVPYGYIITQDELVVLRLFYGDRENPNNLTEGFKKYHYLEYKSIPWTNNVDDELTVNLTLWCLHMLAARRKPIGGRKELRSVYQTPEKSTKGRIAQSESSGNSASDSSSVHDEIQYSFNKRRRSEDTESEKNSGAIRRRRRTNR